MKVLLTGGAGFIGSHTAVELIESGFDIVIADNYSNSSPDVIEWIRQIVDRQENVNKPKQVRNNQISVYDIDVCGKETVCEMFAKEDIDAVIHFAGHKAVGESVEKPLMYYRNNLDSAMTILEVMQEHNVNIFVFSSSATVYGELSPVPFKEDAPTGCSIS